VTVGLPRLHLRSTGSTMDRARALAAAGAPHGTLVSAGEQTAGHGRYGRTWVTPRDRALALSFVLRSFDPLLPLRAGLAVADLAGPAARVKWPNDVLLGGGKVAGVLVEGRPQEGWAVLGIGVNVAVDRETLPPDVAAIAATLGRPVGSLEDALAELLDALSRWLAAPPDAVVAGLGARDAFVGRRLRWAGGTGLGAGIGADGSLLVRRDDGNEVTVSSGEVLLADRPPLAVAASFLDCINRADVDGLGRLMTDDHELSVFDEPPVRGREDCVRAWRGYASAFPRYAIHAHQMVERDGVVAILGHTSGAHVDSDDTIVWVAGIDDGQVGSWRLVDDTPPARRRFGLSDAP
jgi:BirA family transcriptional regulator, biotin operon repressor / biotin---[acetyl-CoA-carboxylase] ligase